jgi:hypothetical protein
MSSEQLGQVAALVPAAVELVDLGAAGEGIRQHHGARVGRPQPRQDDLLRAGLADLAVAGTERSRARSTRRGVIR